MDSPFVRLGTVCKLNQRSITRHDKLDFINYLDTGSLTKNVISTIQTLRFGIDDIPSRAQRKAQAGDILYSMVRPNQRHYGLLKIVPDNFVVSTGFCVISPNKDEIDAEYLYYFLTQDWVVERLQRIGEGAVSSYPAISDDDLASLKMPTPRIKSQQAIAAALSCLDAKIELNRQMNAELELFAKLLYDYWFVQFDFPDNRGRPYKSSGGKMVYSDQLNHEIPSGWKVGKIGEILQTVLGGTPSTKNRTYWENGTINWLSSSEMDAFPITRANARITQSAVDSSATKIMPKGSLVISIVRYIRPSILAIEACANQSVVGILESHTLKNSYLYPYFKDKAVQYMRVRTGAQQPHINKETVDESYIAIPPDEVLKSYYKIASPLYERIILAALEEQELASHRDWLLPLLMSGQVKAGA